MDDLTRQMIPVMLQIRNNLQRDCFEGRCAHEGEVSVINKKLLDIRKVNNPRVGVQISPKRDSVTFHTHLNAMRGWTPPCHGDFISAGIRAAIDPSQHLDFILAREGVYVIDAAELGKVFREDAKRIVMNPEWNVSQQPQNQRLTSWTDEREINKATNRVIRSWFYTWPILSGGSQFEWYRNHGYAFWGPGALSRAIHKPLTRIIEQVEVTKGENFAKMWQEYQEMCRGIGIRIVRFQDQMPMNIV